jgi:hypothetical protein
MVRVFDYDDYRQFLADRIASLPGNGRGELSRIAKAIRVHTSLMSHVFKKSKNLSREQALNISLYLGLSDEEAEYLLCLVDIERAGTQSLRGFLVRRKSQKYC